MRVKQCCWIDLHNVIRPTDVPRKWILGATHGFGADGLEEHRPRPSTLWKTEESDREDHTCSHFASGVVPT
jgi:hypothetical protein